MRPISSSVSTRFAWIASTTKTYDGTYGLVTQVRDANYNLSTSTLDANNLYVATENISGSSIVTDSNGAIAGELHYYPNAGLTSMPLAPCTHPGRRSSLTRNLSMFRNTCNRRERDDRCSILCSYFPAFLCGEPGGRD